MSDNWNTLNEGLPSQQTVGVNSVQLKEGDEFHHKGVNGVPYFRLQVKAMPNRDLYPVMSTSDACSVLPVVMDDKNNVIGAWFLFQSRPETDGVSIKAVGSYCNMGETRVDATLRSLRTKIGVEALAQNLIPSGESYGYGDQYNFPVSCFILKDYEIDLDFALPKGCTRVYMSIREMAEVHHRNGFFGDETIHLVATLLLRNQYPDLFGW